ncbi:hypothetical protein GWR21_27290 [Chitinophaga agri]|uniref:Uncharacterized protein n=2 Tax=Chitinophaga agri TaxID=2703787 RepID=A0A6B9ZL88_9BACT|nr:hypothetical protein [Chitinophaga agri]QHS63158.1 hypothetical protein GWR21_27290 [Chitinophaga agri]
MAYYFISNGPNGAIQKIARFDPIGKDVYNFGFGNLDITTGDISDTAISDNKDVDVIMGTIGSIIYDFTNIFPEAMISIEGTNKARTRLYQMNINKHLERITPIFDVYGLLPDESWESFKRSKNYQAFLGLRKKND